MSSISSLCSEITAILVKLGEALLGLRSVRSTSLPALCILCLKWQGLLRLRRQNHITHTCIHFIWWLSCRDLNYSALKSWNGSHIHVWPNVLCNIKTHMHKDNLDFFLSFPDLFNTKERIYCLYLNLRKGIKTYSVIFNIHSLIKIIQLRTINLRWAREWTSSVLCFHHDSIL